MRSCASAARACGSGTRPWRGIWRRTTLDDYVTESPNWQTVLDLDALGAEEDENWVWKGTDCLEPEYRHCMISLSRGGVDAAVEREFDASIIGAHTIPTKSAQLKGLNMEILDVVDAVPIVTLRFGRTKFRRLDALFAPFKGVAGERYGSTMSTLFRGMKALAKIAANEEPAEVAAAPD